MSSDRVARAQQQWMRERPELDSTPMLVIGRLHRLAAHLTAELLPVYAQFGLGEGEFDVLATLRRAGSPYELAPGELARYTMVTTGAISKRLDRLESAGLVSRRSSEADGRGRYVALTAAGRALIDEAYTAHMRNEARLVGVLSPGDRSALERLLSQWLGEFED
ncbi:MAG: MarR family transcriptional regulator [Propionibacteriaceae bacterium]|nr:MarR family transcriptional regulator [Propionibacteriaceae bacterium]